MHKVRTAAVALAHDIRFWILFFFLIRLIGITNPPLEQAHNWRQCLTNMIGRNFYEEGPDMLHPKIDMAGERTGIIGSEFPLFNYFAYLFSVIFGYSHWYGRLISLLVSSIGIYFFYRLAESLAGKKVAFNSAIILSLSIWFSFSRKSMPDIFGVSIMVTGMFFSLKFLTEGKVGHLLLAFLFLTLGPLCKLPIIYFTAIFPVVLFHPGIRREYKIPFTVVVLLSLVVTAIWYFYWVPHLVGTYGYQLYFPKGLAEGFAEILPVAPKFFERFYFSSFHSFAAFACFVCGVFMLIREKNHRLSAGICLLTVSFLLFALKTGSTFPMHSYYIIPFVPVMAFVAGLGISRMRAPIQYCLIGIIALECLGNQGSDFFLQQKDTFRLTLEGIVEKHIPDNALVIINGGKSPTDIYFSHRKGWSVGDSVLSDPQEISRMDSLGAEYIIYVKKYQTQPDTGFPLVYEDDNYKIVALE